MSRASRVVRVANRRGLHARASAKFVTLAAQQPCEVLVAKHGATDGGPDDGANDGWVAGTSIMGLMMLGAAMGDRIAITATGVGADAAVVALTALVEAKFGED